MKSNVYVEIVDGNDRIKADSISGVYAGDYAEGRIVVTSLTNNAMPFIRYDLGDKGAISNKKCACGCEAPVLKLHTGRKNDFILLRDGNKLSPYIFVGMIDKLNAFTDGAVLQFRIIQADYDKFRVRMYTEEDRDEIKKIASEIFEEDYLYEAEFEIEFVSSSMNVRIDGKYAYFINKLQ